MCKAGNMNGDACYSLAIAPHDLDQDSILQCAIEVRKIKETQRCVQRRGPKGRQTRPGQITDKDMKEAIMRVRNRASEVKDTVVKKAQLVESTGTLNRIVVRRRDRRTVEIGGKYISITKLAFFSKLNQTTVSRIFSGKRSATVKQARQMALALQMGLEPFLDALDERIKKLRQAGGRGTAA